MLLALISLTGTVVWMQIFNFVKTLTEICYGVGYLEVLQVAGFNDADGEPLSSREVADAKKQVTHLLKKTTKLLIVLLIFTAYYLRDT